MLDIYQEVVVPSAVPGSFIINQINARNGTFSWKPLPILDRNGIIVSYSLICNSTQGLVSRLFSKAGSFFMTGFWPDMIYKCSLWAANSAGRGPEVEVSITMMDDYSIFQLRFTVADCGDWVTSASVEKREDLEAALLSELSIICPSCQLDATLIREGRFTRCFEQSSVTYRAQIHGTAQQSSSELVRLIQNWVSEKQSIRILSVEMTIDNQCDTSIASFDVESCTSPSSQDVSLPVIMGAVLGSVILLMLLLIVALVVMFIKRQNTKRRKSVPRENSRKDNDLGPYDVTLHNMNHIFKNRSADEENDNYACIAPHLPPRRSFSGKNELSTTVIPKGHDALSGPFPLGNTNTLYSEIDGRGEGQPESRPSEYEPILVHNVGLMSTETLDTLNTAQFSPGDKEGDKDEEERIMNDYRVPVLYSVVSNHYETIGNPGFQTGSEISLAHNLEEETKSSEEGKVIKNQSFDVLPMTRAGSISISSNPMYSMSTMPMLKNNSLENNASVCHSKNGGPNQNHPEDGYCIPCQVKKRPDLSSQLPEIDNTTKNSPSVRILDGNHGDAEQSIYVNNGFEHAPKVWYTIPTSPKKSSMVDAVAPSTYATISDEPNADSNYHGYSVPRPSNSIPQTDQIGTKIGSYEIPRCSSKGVAECHDVLNELEQSYKSVGAN